MKITIDISDLEKAALEREYKIQGLGADIPGNRPTTMGKIIRKLVEAIRKGEAIDH